MPRGGKREGAGRKKVSSTDARRAINVVAEQTTSSIQGSMVQQEIKDSKEEVNGKACETKNHNHIGSNESDKLSQGTLSTVPELHSNQGCESKDGQTKDNRSSLYVQGIISKMGSDEIKDSNQNEPKEIILKDIATNAISTWTQVSQRWSKAWSGSKDATSKQGHSKHAKISGADSSSRIQKSGSHGIQTRGV